MLSKIPATIGLVACGGNSTRMGADKSMLVYHDKPQRYHVYELLQPVCEKVFISCKPEQVPSISNEYNFLADDPSWNDIGPMAALLTAFTEFPGKNMLLIGCDYPFLTKNDIAGFSHQFSEDHSVVSFYNEEAGLYEPLLCWYHYSAFPRLKELFNAGKYSLQNFLNEAPTTKFYPSAKNCITSVDSQDAFVKAHIELSH